MVLLQYIHVLLLAALSLLGLVRGFSLHKQFDEPIILSLPDILSSSQVSDMIHTVDVAIQSGSIKPTQSYQEDIFSKDKFLTEEDTLQRILQKVLNEQLIPSEYIIHINDGEERDESSSMLPAFVYAVKNYQDRIPEGDIIAGANIIQRRNAINKWKSEDGSNIMKLSCDNIVVDDNGAIDWDSIRLGKRYELPPDILTQLEQLIPMFLLGNWKTNDATLVKYNEGELQVPHIDPCQATLLICLQSCDEGGDTCFPLLEDQRRENKAGNGILFFSSNKKGGQNTLSLHHGAKVLKGGKIVVQLMLDLVADDLSNKAPESWLDYIIDT